MFIRERYIPALPMKPSDGAGPSPHGPQENETERRAWVGSQTRVRRMPHGSPIVERPKPEVSDFPF